MNHFITKHLLFLIVGTVCFYTSASSQSGDKQKREKTIIEKKGIEVRTQVPEKPSPPDRPIGPKGRVAGGGEGQATSARRPASWTPVEPHAPAQATIDGLKRLQALSNFMKLLSICLVGKKILDLIANPNEVLLAEVISVTESEWKDLAVTLSKMKAQEREIAMPILDEIEFQVSQEYDRARQGNAPNMAQIAKELAFWRKFNGGAHYIHAELRPSPYDIRLFTDNNLPESVSFGSVGDIQRGFYLKPFFRVRHVPSYGCKVTLKFQVKVAKTVAPVPPAASEHDPNASFLLSQDEDLPGLEIAETPFLLTLNSGLNLPLFAYEGKTPTGFFLFIEEKNIRLPKGRFKMQAQYEIWVDNKKVSVSKPDIFYYTKTTEAPPDPFRNFGQ